MQRKRLTRARESYPLGHIGELEDIAGVAVLLASRAGYFMTGQTLVIDGGTTVMGDNIVEGSEDVRS